ncbi:hypothetical protein ACFQ88_14405 [Paenibacillus sp. NPDC056579]|uniref:hypothetical protein n=1 Tax=Paenibacillus sp. NPDC056579 TaxID=3345871 RepID=UPI003686D671
MRPLPKAACILICFSLCLSLLAGPALAANDDTKLLLQKSLTVFEIDQELARIEQEQSKLVLQLASTEQRLHEQQALSVQTKKHAGQILRAYYMGDRESLWMLLFTVSSFKEALVMFEYMQMILGNDHRTLQAYKDSERQLKDLTSSLRSSQDALQQSKDRYTKQREQQVLLQRQIDTELSMQADAAPVLKQITDLTVQWQEKGIPLFRTYFTALAQAMKQLPELVNATGADGKNTHLIMNGFQYTFQITDQELNAFLRTKNPLFNNMTFRFKDSQVIATGKQDQMEVAIKGSYEIATKESVKGKYIRFHMSQLKFNGFDLPQTTIEAMEKDFDLGIYPQSIASFLQVTDVRLQEGKLSIFLKLAL